MKKIVLLAVLVLSTLSMAMASKDSRGVLLMSEEEWMNFYNQPGNDIPLCAIIGSLKMEEGYIKDGKKMGETLAENKKAQRDISLVLASQGLKDVNQGNTKVHELYYAAVCKRFTDKEYNMVGSPSFKNEMERIFSEHQFEYDVTE